MGQLILIGLFKLIVFGLASMVRWRKLAEFKEEEEEKEEEEKNDEEKISKEKISKDETLKEKKKKKKSEEEKDKKPEEKKSIISKIKNGCFWLVLLLDHRTGLAFYWMVFNSMQVDLFLGSWAAFKALDFSNIWTIVSILIPIGFFINYFIFMIYITKGFFDFYLPKTEKTYSKELEKAYKSVNKTYLMIFDDLKPNTVYGLWILAILSSKDTFLPFLLIYGINSPLIQAIPILIMFIGVVVFVAVARPFKSKVETGMAIFNSLAYVVALTIFIALDLLKNTFTEVQKYQIIGNLIILSLSIIVAVNLTVGFCCTIAAFWPFIRPYVCKKQEGLNKIKQADKSLNESSLGLNNNDPKKRKRDSSPGKKKRKIKPASKKLKKRSGNKLKKEDP